MILATYKGESYEYSREKDGIEIYVKGRREGFNYRKHNADIYSYKIIQEEEIDEIFEVFYFATWKEDEYEVSAEENQTILLDISDAERRYNYFIENGFEMKDRGEFCKFVPESECSNFIMIKKSYEDKKWVETEKKKLTLEEFKKSYYENVNRFF